MTEKRLARQDGGRTTESSQAAERIPVALRNREASEQRVTLRRVRNVDDDAPAAQRIPVLRLPQTDDPEEETRRFHSDELDALTRQLKGQEESRIALRRRLLSAPSPDEVLPDLRESVAAPAPPEPPPAITRAEFDWRESNLTRKPAAFRIAHGLVKLLAIVVGFGATTLGLMALLGAVVEGRLVVHAGIAAAVALVVPAVVARRLRPKDDPLVAIGLTSETYALSLLAFAVVFVVAAHDYTAPLLTREGDRAAHAGQGAVARAAWFLARVERR